MQPSRHISLNFSNIDLPNVVALSQEKEKFLITSHSFEHIFQKHYDELVRYAFTLLKEQDLAQDMVQKLFVNLWEKRDHLEIQSNIRSYLFTAVYRTCLNKLKQIKEDRNKRVPLENEQIKAVTTDNFVIQGELEQSIARAMEKLPEKCREVFGLSRIKNYSYAEIAQALDISVKTVENHMGKALKMMRVELAEYLTLFFIWTQQ